MTDRQERQERGAVDDMLADFAISDAEADQLRTVLDQVAALANERPEPSGDLRALLDGVIPLHSGRRSLMGSSRPQKLVVMAAGALALSGVSAAAATNRLPDPVQEFVASATDGILPVDIPHPTRPVNPPADAPGHVKNDSDDHDQDAPGQVQKDTKPDPRAPGPARPADPGSHGRTHNPDKTNQGNHGQHKGGNNDKD